MVYPYSDIDTQFQYVSGSSRHPPAFQCAKKQATSFQLFTHRHCQKMAARANGVYSDTRLIAIHRMTVGQAAPACSSSGFLYSSATLCTAVPTAVYTSSRAGLGPHTDKPTRCVIHEDSPRVLLIINSPLGFVSLHHSSTNNIYRSRIPCQLKIPLDFCGAGPRDAR